MGTIVGAMASSHAFALIEPKLWDEYRARNRENYRRRYGKDAPIQPEIETETLADNERRYKNLTAAFDRLRGQIAETRPDVLLVIGDDQNENLTSENLPQIALYTGPEFVLNRRTKRTARYRTHLDVTNALLTRGIEEGFDFAALGSFKEDELLSHAHWQLLDLLLPNADIPVVLVFLNAIHYPAVTPRRCYALGQLIARVVAGRPAGEKVLLCGSGGLSHFTAGYPWRQYRGPFGYGAISEDFDRKLLRHIEAGEGRILAELSSDDLLAHGDIEFRSWIAVLGAIGAQRSRFTVYEPFYRAIGGMGVASWPGVG